MTTDFVLSPDVAQLHFILADEKHIIVVVYEL